MENTKTIDMTPTWKGLLPVLVHLVENATTSESRHVAMDELTRMANLADLYVTSQKENN
jgi:hypothetical protein